MLEERYAAFDGLNLCFETREGILKHCAPASAARLGSVGERFIKKQRPSLEAQIANLADEIAYNNHDVDDGLRSGLISLEQIASVRLFASNLDVVRQAHPSIGDRRLIHETIRHMINTLATDLILQTGQNIQTHGIQNLDDVRSAQPLAAFSTGVREQSRELKAFLHIHLYRHYQVMRMNTKAHRIISELFKVFMEDGRLLPPQYHRQAEADRARAVSDYIAGMTDRYAIREHRRIFAVEEI